MIRNKISFIIITIIFLFAFDRVQGMRLFSNPSGDIIANSLEEHNNIKLTSKSTFYWPWWCYRKNGIGRDKYGRAREVSWSWNEIGNLFKLNLNISFESVDYSDPSIHLDENGELSASFRARARAAGYYYRPVPSSKRQDW